MSQSVGSPPDPRGSIGQIAEAQLPIPTFGSSCDLIERAHCASNAVTVFLVIDFSDGDRRFCHALFRSFHVGRDGACLPSRKRLRCAVRLDPVVQSPVRDRTTRPPARTAAAASRGRVEDGRGSLGPMATPRFPCRSSNRAPIFGTRPSNWLHREAYGDKLTARGFGTVSNSPSPLDTAISGGSCPCWCLQAHRQSPRLRHLQKHARSRGPLLCQHYPASTLLLPRPTPAVTTANAMLRPLPSSSTGLPCNCEPPFRRPVPLPRRIAWGRASIASQHVRLSPNDRRVGIRIRTFEACSDFTLLRPIGSFSSQGRLRRRVPTQLVTQPSRLPASGPIDNFPGEILPH
ncbi:hypothetical protein ACVIGA_003115 [Bradyrhizobium sp. USDA 3240]